jgi:hypothetical protein
MPAASGHGAAPPQAAGREAIEAKADDAFGALGHLRLKS